MKDNIREALFNLIGGWVEGKAVFDLFAGTGAIGLEALSRGASQVNFVERHFPTAKIVQQNIAALDASLNEVAEVHASDTFFWVRQFVTKSDLPTEPWMVFCCPPYDFYVERSEEVLVMLDAMLALAPANSLFIVESDDRFDASTLPSAPDSIQPEDDEKPIEWVVRQYAPAQVAILKLF